MLNCNHKGPNIYPNSPHSQGGMKFATQISPLLNYYLFRSYGHFWLKFFGLLVFIYSVVWFRSTGPTSEITTQKRKRKIFLLHQDFKRGPLELRACVLPMNYADLG